MDISRRPHAHRGRQPGLHQGDGSTYHPAFFSDRWDRLVELSGLPPIRLHDGRHEAASLALAAGVAPKAVQAMLGHATVETPTRPEKAANKNALKKRRRRVA
ncbi:tyrosine-type recombinase/integrase [Streptomyces sp. LN245]|uniref:tyrosine-type recombinase/integrase n=1 Tax=Streptomyces sp. LN245 TaxID=3112975 RepID=UPI00371D0CE0